MVVRIELDALIVCLSHKINETPTHRVHRVDTGETRFRLNKAVRTLAFGSKRPNGRELTKEELIQVAGRLHIVPLNVNATKDAIVNVVNRVTHSFLEKVEFASKSVSKSASKVMSKSASKPTIRSAPKSAKSIVAKHVSSKKSPAKSVRFAKSQVDPDILDLYISNSNPFATMFVIQDSNDNGLGVDGVTYHYYVEHNHPPRTIGDQIIATVAKDVVKDSRKRHLVIKGVSKHDAGTTDDDSLTCAEVGKMRTPSETLYTPVYKGAKAECSGMFYATASMKVLNAEIQAAITEATRLQSSIKRQVVGKSVAAAKPLKIKNVRIASVLAKYNRAVAAAESAHARVVSAKNSKSATRVHVDRHKVNTQRRTAGKHLFKNLASVGVRWKSTPGAQAYKKKCILNTGCRHPSLPKGLRAYTTSNFPNAKRPVPRCCKRNVITMMKRAQMLARLKEALGAMDPTEASAVLKRSTLPKDMQGNMMKSIKTGTTLLDATLDTLAKKDSSTQAYVMAFVSRIQNALVAALARLFSQAKKKPDDDDETSKAWKLFTLMRKATSFIAKSAFNVTTWIVAHPQTAHFMTTMALNVRQQLCKEISRQCSLNETCRSWTGFEKAGRRKISIGHKMRNMASPDNIKTFMSMAINAGYSFINNASFGSMLNVAGDMLLGTFSALTVGPFGSVVTVGFKAIWGVMSEATVQTAQTMALAALVRDAGSNILELWTLDCLVQPAFHMETDVWLASGDARDECTHDSDCAGGPYSKCATDGFCWNTHAPPGAGNLAAGAAGAAKGAVAGVTGAVAGAAGAVTGAIGGAFKGIFG